MDDDSAESWENRFRDWSLYFFIGLILGMSLFLLGFETVGQVISTISGSLAFFFIGLATLIRLYIGFSGKH